MDLNSQMGLGPTNYTGFAPTNFLDLRDNQPGYADDVFLGYEQTAFQFRNGPEKFAARNIVSNNIVSLGAETYYYTVGGTSNVGLRLRLRRRASPTRPRTGFIMIRPQQRHVAKPNPPTQRNPLSPTAGQSADIWVEGRLSVSNQHLFHLLHHRRLESRRRVWHGQRHDAGGAGVLCQPRQRARTTLTGGREPFPRSRTARRCATRSRCFTAAAFMPARASRRFPTRETIRLQALRPDAGGHHQFQSHHGHRLAAQRS